ncbi:hypothetical protein JCM1840_002655 [Sporobolomyces johnsonii]
MADRLSYGSQRNQPAYPTSSVPGSQEPFAGSFPAYAYHSQSTTPMQEHHSFQHHDYSPLLPQQHQQAAASHPSSAHSSQRARSASAEQRGHLTPAPIQTTFVLPSHADGISPTAIYEGQQAPSGSPSIFQPFSPHLTSLSQFSDPLQHPPRHHRHPPVYSSPVPPSCLPGGMVGSAEGWNDAATSVNDALPDPYPLQGSKDVSGKKKAADKSARSRKRSPASCAPCRKKKLKCDRCLPCSSCVQRGDPDGCIWEGDATPLYTLRDETDAKQLRAQVDRLQALVDSLAGTSPRGDPRGSAASNASQASGATEDALDDEEASFDLHAQDLCGALSELALNGVMPPQQTGGESFAPGGTSGDALVEEATRFCASFTQRLGLSADLSLNMFTPSSSEASPASTTVQPPPDYAANAPFSPTCLGFSCALLNVRPTISQLLEVLPHDDELQPTFKHYVSYVHWYATPLHLPTFEQQWANLRRALAEEDPARCEQDVDPIFIATLLGACAAGLANMTAKQANTRGFPNDRTQIVERWINAAMMALVAGKFMEKPTLDGVRASVLIACHYIFMTPGETIAAGMSLLALAVHASFALELHRDPVRNGKTKLTFLECEDRRRIFWTLFTLCMSITTGTSRSWTQFDLRQIDCKIPLDCYDEELFMDERAVTANVRARRNSVSFEETPMTLLVVRAQYSVLVKKITDAAFSVTPCRYSDILGLDLELQAFEKSFPPCYQLPLNAEGDVLFGSPPSMTEMRSSLLHLCLASEVVRLHRPFLVLAANDALYQHSRDQSIKYAKRLLAINATPGCRLSWAGHNFKVLSAAIVLAIEALQSPDERDIDQIKSTVTMAVQQTESFAKVSSVCRKGSGIVRFLLSKVDQEAASRQAPRRAKRARTIHCRPDHGASGRRNLADALTWPASAPMSTNTSHDGSPESREHDAGQRRRKPVRPPLVTANSETVISRSSTPVAQGVRPHRSHSADELDRSTLPTLGSLSIPHFAVNTRPFVGLRTSYRSPTSPSSTAAVGAGGAPTSFSSPHPTLHSFADHSRPGQLSLFPDVGLGLDDHPSLLDNGPPTSTSLYDEHDVSPFFSLPVLSDPSSSEQREGHSERSRSRFNAPLDEGSDFGKEYGQF